MLPITSEKFRHFVLEAVQSTSRRIKRRLSIVFHFRVKHKQISKPTCQSLWRLFWSVIDVKRTRKLSTVINLLNWNDCLQFYENCSMMLLCIVFNDEWSSRGLKYSCLCTSPSLVRATVLFFICLVYFFYLVQFSPSWSSQSSEDVV